MRIVNLHARSYRAHASTLAPFIEGLGSRTDRLWPRDRWPAMVLKQGLAVGSAGGHGPVRYVVRHHETGRVAAFRFIHPRGWHGSHGFRVDPLPDGGSRLSHWLEMEAHGSGLILWALVFRPLHDALIEEALDRVATELGEPCQAPPWSASVRLLRWALKPRASSWRGAWAARHRRQR